MFLVATRRSFGFAPAPQPAPAGPPPASVSPCSSVLILLPPSEGKTAPAGGAPVNLGALAYKADRQGGALAALGQGELLRAAQRTALKALGLSPGQAGELDRNARWSPAAPAAESARAACYERLRLPERPAGRARAGADRERPVGRRATRTTGYRPTGCRSRRGCHGSPGWRAYWQAGARAGAARRGAHRDLRSGGYAAAWTPRHATVVGVRGFTEQDGARKVITHHVKSVRGDVARALQAPGPARSPRTSPRSALRPGTGWLEARRAPAST